MKLTKCLSNIAARIILAAMFILTFSLEEASSQKLDFYWDYIPVERSATFLNAVTFQGNSMYALVGEGNGESYLLISHDRFGQRNTESYSDSNIRRANSIFALADGKFIMNLTYFKGNYNYFIFSSDSGITLENKYFLSANHDTLLKKEEVMLLTHFWDNGKALVISLFHDSIMNRYFSEDYGESWIKHDSMIVNGLSTSSGYTIPFDISKYKLVSEGTILQPILIQMDKFFKVSNYGQTLEIIELSNTAKRHLSAFKDTLNGIIDFADSYYRTEDGMKTFIPIDITTESGDAIMGITYAQPSISYPEGFYYAYGAGGHYVSYDDGDSWTKVHYDNSAWYGIIFDKNDYAIGVNSTEQQLMFMDNHINSIYSFNKPPISLYPNPTQKEIILKEIQPNSEYKILNSLGAEVLSGVYNGNAIPVADLPIGIYLIQIQKEREVFQVRFVKE
ncbi:MAG: T9SS type A sorting domain-containing protein [Bacteroidetes bacterium]|nr:T9SS type A sorting domain-containing protein [Bacteroidota bacterium]